MQMPNETIKHKTTGHCKILNNLPQAATEIDILRALCKNCVLTSISKLFNAGCTTIFCPRDKGVTVHAPSKDDTKQLGNIFL